MCPALVLISACLSFIYYPHSTSATVLLVEVSATDNNATQHTSHFNATVDSFNKLLYCLESNFSSLCCLRNNFEVNNYLNRLWHQCPNMASCVTNGTAVTPVDPSVGNNKTFKMYAALELNLPTGCGFLKLNVTAKLNGTGITFSNTSYTYVIRIVAMASGLVGGLIAVMCFVCLLRRGSKMKTLELIAGDVHEPVSRASNCTIDSLQGIDYTNQSHEDIEESSGVFSGTQCDLNYSYCPRDFYCCSNPNLNFENCRAASREGGEYYNVSHSDVRSQTDAGEADAEISPVYIMAALETEPENIYHVPVNRNGRRYSVTGCYVNLYDVKSVDGIYHNANCVYKLLPNLPSKKRSERKSVFYSEANLHNNTGRESFHYSEPVVFGGFNRQVLNVGGSASHNSYVNTESAAVACVEV